MNCPFCNATMKEGQVFCEKCGKEIHLVPLFDPEMEETMQASIFGIVEELSQKPQDDKNHQTDTTFQTNEYSTEEPKTGKKKLLFLTSLVILGVFMAVIILLSVVGLSRPADFNEYLQRTKDAYAAENYERAISLGQQALEVHSGENAGLLELYMVMARAYNGLSQTAQAESLLTQTISLFPEERAPYELLISIEEEQQDYERLADILADCQNQQILSTYAKYMCNEPEFDTETGTYEEIVYLRLIADGKGKIYYTINGGLPDENSDTFMSPIKLENGNFEIQAVFMNEYGVKSEVASAGYNILLATLDEPEISLDDGTYTEPQMIEVYMPDESYSVYYTMDGSEPNLSSSKYENAILLPFGESVYHFVMYDEDGVASEIAKRSYQFELQNPAVVIDQARIMLLQNLIIRGYLLDPEGHVSLAGTEEVRQYSCNSAFAQAGENYYLFSENAVDALGNSIRTGTYFAVNVSTGEIFRAESARDGYYHISAF